MKITVVKKNEIYDMEITAQGTEGEGIGRIEGLTIFVKNGVRGDVARVKILKVNKSYAYAKIESLISPSPFRTNPICGTYGRCGGCNFMHIQYDEQLRLKRQRVYDALTRIGGFESIDVPNTIGMDNPYNYRNKTQLPIGCSADGKVVTGFFAPRSHTICPMDECCVAPHVLKSVVDTVKLFMTKYGIAPYDEKTHKGIIRHIFVRIAKSSDVMVVIVTNSLNIKHCDVLVDMLKKDVDGLVSIIQNINMERTNLILGKNNATLWGTDTLTDTISNLKFEISPLSFYQVNSLQTEKLYQTALDFASLDGSETVFDLYCGIGTISLFMASKAKTVFGIEISPDAVHDAGHNAKINNINNVHFYCGAVEKTVVELYNVGERADVVMLDPPRKGADEITLDTIIKIQPKRVVYVSCNPETLARDAKFLRENGGYEICKVQPVDMFPHTVHVETVVLMSMAEK